MESASPRPLAILCYDPGNAFQPNFLESYSLSKASLISRVAAISFLFLKGAHCLGLKPVSVFSPSLSPSPTLPACLVPSYGRANCHVGDHVPALYIQSGSGVAAWHLFADVASFRLVAISPHAATRAHVIPPSVPPSQTDASGSPASLAGPRTSPCGTALCGTL